VFADANVSSLVRELHQVQVKQIIMLIRGVVHLSYAWAMIQYHGCEHDWFSHVQACAIWRDPTVTGEFSLLHVLIIYLPTQVFAAIPWKLARVCINTSVFKLLMQHTNTTHSNSYLLQTQQLTCVEAI
jgi:hypothetical protein